jgi:hypothetical protein
MIDQVLAEIRETLQLHGVNAQGIIEEFGQVRAYEERKAGREFSLNDHVRGMILAQLSNQRPWGPIAANLSKIDRIFSHYDSSVLKEEDPGGLTQKVLGIRCGNRKIAAQMEGLSSNIAILESIANAFGSLDQYVTSIDAESIAKELGSGKRFKLREIGFTLAMEYLRNVGINAIKPDLHICRIIGPERLGLLDKVPTPEEAYTCLMKLQEGSVENAIYIDNLIWLFAAQDYGNICTASPKCNECRVKSCVRCPF